MNNGNDNFKRNRFHRRSFFGPILLITIGLVFLAKNIGLIPGEGWGTVWRLWPLLLIIGGLDDLFRREGIAWPILMIGVGGALLYNYFGPQSWISWTQVIQLWPILLIAVGIDILFKGQSGWKSLLGALLAVILIGGAVLMVTQGGQVQVDHLKIDEQMPTNIDLAEVDLSIRVGEIILGAETQSGKLISGDVAPGSVRDELDKKSGLVSYGLESTKPTFFPRAASWELGLATGIPLELEVDNSIGEMQLDLTKLELDSLAVNQAIGRINIDFPDVISEEVLVKQGIGIIEIFLPEGVRIAVDAQNGLSRVSFPADFELDKGFYTTPGATKNNAVLVIVVEQGIGLIRFEYE